jgi:hypothetical protein
MADGGNLTAGAGLVVSTGILGDLVLPPGAFYATQACGPGALRAYRSVWRQYDAWCMRDQS